MTFVVTFVIPIHITTHNVKYQAISQISPWLGMNHCRFILAVICVVMESSEEVDQGVTRRSTDTDKVVGAKIVDLESIEVVLCDDTFR